MKKTLIAGVGYHNLSDMSLGPILTRRLQQMDFPAEVEVVAELLEAVPETRGLKDPTRGGLATTLNEIALNSEAAIAIDETAIPVRPQVRGACEILGLDPLTIANEGKLIAIVPPEAEADALEAMRSHPLGVEACAIGEVRSEPVGMVFLRTEIGGTRVLDMLVGDPLPRIC